MNFFDHRKLGNHLLQLCPKVVKHCMCVCVSIYIYTVFVIYMPAGMFHIKIPNTVENAFIDESGFRAFVG